MAMSGDISGGSTVRGVGMGKMLLNIPQCTGQRPLLPASPAPPAPRPTTKNYLVPNVSVAKVENSFPRASILRVTQKFLI